MEQAPGSKRRFGKPAPPGQRFNFTLDGRPIQALEGETIAAALYANGVRAWRKSRHSDSRGLLCGIGICFDCLVMVQAAGTSDAAEAVEPASVRACLTIVREGMQVTTSMPGKDASLSVMGSTAADRTESVEGDTD